MDENRLVDLLQQDDEKAFDSLYYHYHAKVFNLCRRFSLRKEEAEEIVQVVFVTLWENRHKIDKNLSLAGYILSVTRHKIYNSLRKNIYKQNYIDYLVKNDKSIGSVTEDEIFFNDLDNFLSKLITQLPPRRKEIFLLSRNEGLSYREIADQLSITESTVNTQLTKALDFIRKNIELWY